MITNTYIISFILFALFVNVKSDRKVTAVLNPGCGSLPVCNSIKLVHVKAEGENDTLHHLWDFTGKPSVLLALTEKDASLSVSWQQFFTLKEGSVTIQPTPKYTYGLVLDKVIEFNDEEDTGALNLTNNNPAYLSLLDTQKFNWKLTNLTNSSGDATLTVEATEYSDTRANIKKNGTVRIVISAYGGEENSDSLPHLLHSGNASQIDLTVDGLSTQYKSSRFGVHIVTVSSDNPNNTVDIKPRKTLNDEHAPGVFTIVEMLTPEAQSGGCGGYLQWRPVVYTSATRDMTSSTESFQYSVRALPDARTTLDRTLLLSALGSKLNSMLTVATNVTFGVAGDGFYTKNRYASWTVLVGYGHPPKEEFSMLVTLVVLIGLGLPAILILTGTVCIILRRLQRNKDDLFLSR